MQARQLRCLLLNVTTYSAAISACEKGQMPNTTTCDASVAEDAARKPPARRDRLQRGYSALSSAGRQTEALQRAGQPATVMHPVLVSRGTASPGPGWVPPAAPGGLWCSQAGGKRTQLQRGEQRIPAVAHGLVGLVARALVERWPCRMPWLCVSCSVASCVHRSPHEGVGPASRGASALLRFV